MREILFRDKRLDTGEWIFGGALHQTDYYGENVDSWYIIDGTCTNDYDIGYSYAVDPSTVGQYTGLHDKNGNWIFEGDIFKFNDEVWEGCFTSCGMEYDSYEVENFGGVGYCEYSGRFDFVRYKFSENSVEADLHENNNLEYADFVSELEIIGNIHDNPELLLERKEECNT